MHVRTALESNGYAYRLVRSCWVSLYLYLRSLGKIDKFCE